MGLVRKDVVTMALKCTARYRNPLFVLEFREPARANRVGVALAVGELLYGLTPACEQELLRLAPDHFAQVADATRGRAPTDQQIQERLRGEEE